MDAETSDLIDKAEELEETGLYAEAAIIWQEIVGREPDPLSLCRLGSLLLEIDDCSEAERAFLAATALDSNLPQPYEGLAVP